jgi:cation transport ATPase
VAGLLYSVTGLLLPPLIPAATMILPSVSVRTNALRVQRVDL